MATLNDIARATQLSVMTVSRCMRNDPRHSAATRKRVHDMAKRMGYVPNPLVSTLMAQLRQNHAKADGSVIALIGFYPRFVLSVSSTWRRFESGIRARAAQLGFGCEWFALNDYPEARGLAHLRKILRTRGINAGIIFPLPAPAYQLRLDSSGLALASLGFSLDQPRVHRVSHHHYTGLHRGIAEAKARGYRRIALALPSNYDENVDHQWLAALAVEPCRAGSAPADFAYLCPSQTDTTNLAVRDGFLTWVRATQPDLIFGLHPFSVWWETHLRDAPEKIDFASLDYSPDTPHLAGIDQMSENIGASAVDVVVAQLHRNETGVPAYQKILHVESHWRAGASIRRPLLPAPHSALPVS
jgi:LacI family transcriptional regulator